MTGKVMWTRLAALIAAIALVFGLSFADPYMTNAAALAEENFLSVAEGDSIALPAGEETVPQAAEESADEEDAVASLPTGEETVPQADEADIDEKGTGEEATSEEGVDDSLPAGEETVPQAAKADADEEDAVASLPAEEESVPQTTEADAGEEDADASLPAGGEITPPDAEDDPESAGTDEETAPRDPEDAGRADGGENAPDSEAAAEPEDEEESGLPADFSFDEEDDEPESWNEEDLVVMEDGDAGYISEEITEQFNNPDHEEPSPFIGTAEIRLMNEGMLHYGDWIVLKAEVRDVNLSHRLVWEANDGSGWFTVGYGETFSFILREESADCEYRVSIIAVD